MSEYNFHDNPQDPRDHGPVSNNPIRFQPITPPWANHHDTAPQPDRRPLIVPPDDRGGGKSQNPETSLPHPETAVPAIGETALSEVTAGPETTGRLDEDAYFDVTRFKDVRPADAEEEARVLRLVSNAIATSRQQYAAYENPAIKDGEAEASLMTEIASPPSLTRLSINSRPDSEEGFFPYQVFVATVSDMEGAEQSYTYFVRDDKLIRYNDDVIGGATTEEVSSEQMTDVFALADTIADGKAAGHESDLSPVSEPEAAYLAAKIRQAEPRVESARTLMDLAETNASLPEDREITSGQARDAAENYIRNINWHLEHGTPLDATSDSELEAMKGITTNVRIVPGTNPGPPNVEVRITYPYDDAFEPLPDQGAIPKADAFMKVVYTVQGSELWTGVQAADIDEHGLHCNESDIAWSRATLEQSARLNRLLRKVRY